MTITVVTVTYNAEATLPRTLRSVEEQTFAQVEHIILDGQSRDATVSIAREYAAAQRRHTVLVISEPDKGIYDAMNKGLTAATGDYIVFMNAGDCFAEPATLQHVADAIRQSSVSEEAMPGVVYGETLWTDSDGNIIGKRNHQAPAELSWRSFKGGMLVCHQSFYARTDIALLTPYDTRYRFSADVDWCIRVMKEAETQQLALVNTNRVLTHYLREGTTTANHRASLRERFDIMCRHYGLPTTLLMHLKLALRRLA